jgi:beta-hydroxylase
MFYSKDEFPWTRYLEDSFVAIREEYEALDQRRIRPWPETKVYNHGWKAFGLYGFGSRIDENCALCPRLAAVLDVIPGLTTAGFSVLSPGTVIKPHRGYTSSVLRCHLGISVPGDCALRVGDATQTWREGECFVFDDTVEHEAWNRSDRARVVLLLDFVRPGGTPDGVSTAQSQLILRYFNAKAPTPS